MSKRKYEDNYVKIVKSNDTRVKWIIVVGLLGLTLFRYFYKLDARMSFDVDEEISFARAVGFLKTGTFYQWDFVNDCITNIGSTVQPGYAVLLAAWLKIFGVSIIAARSLSAVLGCVFVLSFIYISFKMFERWDVTCIATCFVILEPNITYWFRFIRYYSLVMVLSIWVVYFAYKALTETNTFKKNNKCNMFIEKNFNFNIVYCLLAVIITCLAISIHNIQLAVFFGILLFVVYKAITTRERKYICISVAALIMIVIVGIIIVCGGALEYIPGIGYFARVLKFWIDYGVYRNVEYYWDSVNSLSNQMLMYAGWFLALFLLFSKRKNKEYKEKILYLLLIQVGAIVFMVWFANNYYQARYLCFILPISILICFVGVAEILGKYRLADLVLMCILIGHAVYVIDDSYEYLYTIYTAPASQKVYEIVNAECPGEKNIFGIDRDMMYGGGYFATEYLENWDYTYWENYDTEMSFIKMIEFAQANPQGIVWLVEDQIYNRRNHQLYFFECWVDRIAGRGMDNYNIEVGVLNYIEPECVEDTISSSVVELHKIIAEEQLTMEVLVDGSKIEEDVELICVRLVVTNESGETETLKFQLGIPENNYNKVWKYVIQLGKMEEAYLEENSYGIMRANEIEVRVVD